MAIPSANHPCFMGKNIFPYTLCVTKFAGKTFSSDLRKLTAVSKSLSKSKKKKIHYSVIERII